MPGRTLIDWARVLLRPAAADTFRKEGDGPLGRGYVQPGNAKNAGGRLTQ